MIYIIFTTIYTFFISIVFSVGAGISFSFCELFKIVILKESLNKILKQSRDFIFRSYKAIWIGVIYFWSYFMISFWLSKIFNISDKQLEKIFVNFHGTELTILFVCICYSLAVGVSHGNFRKLKYWTFIPAVFSIFAGYFSSLLFLLFPHEPENIKYLMLSTFFWGLIMGATLWVSDQIMFFINKKVGILKCN